MRLDWGGDPVVEWQPTRLTTPTADVDDLFCSLDWAVTRAGTFGRAGHINLQEVRALRGEVKRPHGEGVASRVTRRAREAAACASRRSSTRPSRSSAATRARSTWAGAMLRPSQRSTGCNPSRSRGHRHSCVRTYLCTYMRTNVRIYECNGNP